MNIPFLRVGSKPAAAENEFGRVMGRRRVLMIAYHFPPLAGSSGIQRTLRFVQHLPQLGWDPVILTAHPRAYASTSEDLVSEIPKNVHVERVFALDSARHLAIRGRYPGFAARPDRWVSWWLGAVPAGWSLIRRFRPHVIWSTYPIATAHLIGRFLQQISGLPWVADFRDPMAQDGYPEDAAVWRSFQRIEAGAFRTAAACTFTTPGAIRMYRERYSEVPPGRFHLIENGFDEESFGALNADAQDTEPLLEGRLTLLHSGIVYPSERDPRHLMAALALIKSEDPDAAARLLVRFRASVHESVLRELAASHGVEDLIDIQPAVPYREALKEMVSADGLVVLQAANCSDQVPAKIYEYFRAGRPLLAFTNEGGDTARLLVRMGLPIAAPLDDPDRIAVALLRFVRDADWRRRLVASAGAVREESREARSRQLARLLEVVILGSRRAPSGIEIGMT
jgi:glycosyltransferase involved in cell wall biosynthesis